ETLSAGVAASGSVSLAGAVSWNKMGNTVDAHVADGATLTTPGTVTVSATDNATIASLSGQAAGGNAGAIGGAAAYNEFHETLRADINNATIASNLESVVLSAVSSATIRTIAAGGALGGLAGVAGSVAINLFANDVQTFILGSAVRADGS